MKSQFPTEHFRVSLAYGGSYQQGTNPVIKQEPNWVPPSSISAISSLTSPEAHFSSSFGLPRSTFSGSTGPGSLHAGPLSLGDLRGDLQRGNKRRPGPYDNLKDPSGKIKLELVSIFILIFNFDGHHPTHKL